ncbi:MAG TPA: two-component regulator propeller domain-containing protein [Bacteroidales bacterium]|nr:two-component regulator propeller domain-containing protein [Bacteroidales bacterium]HPS15986.1 two-component regulator propeller domain-containing protein [Bacteroidales bacterium]
MKSPDSHLSRLFKKFSFLFYLFVFSVPVFSQQYNFKNYTVKDGLPSNEVYQVIQDSKGYMWFATDYGVSCFDGYKFKNFNTKDGLPDNTIFEIYEDYKGRIWFISRSAKLSYFYNDSIHLYWNNDKFLKYIGDVPNIINKTFSVDEQDNVCIGIYTKGIFKISKTGRVYRKNSYNLNIYTYVFNIEKNIVYLDYPDTTKSYKYDKGIVAFIKENNKFYKIKLDEKNVLVNVMPILCIRGNTGNIYFSINSIIHCMNKIPEYIYYTFQNNKIISLYIDIENNLWVGTQFGGFYSFKDGDITKEPELHLLKDKAGTSILRDKEGGYWVTTIYDGIYYFPSIKYKTYNSTNGLAEDAQNILETDGKSIYSATLLSPYINKIAERKIKKINFFNDSNKSITSIFYDTANKTLWIGTRKYLYLLKDKKIKEFNRYFYMPGHYFPGCSFVSGEINEIAQTKNKKIWYGTINGLCNVNKDTVYTYKPPKSFLRTYSLLEDKENTFWIGSNDGLYKFENGNYKYYGNKNPLLKNRITSIKRIDIDSCILIATKGAGILVMKGNNVLQISEKDGLLSNHIKHLFIDKNVIWASSNNGLNKITISNKNTFSFKIENFTQEDGLISSEINSVLVLRDSVYVATKNGLCIFNKNEVHTNTTPPPVYITGIKIMNDDTLVQSTYTLPYDKNFIEINFVGLTYRTAGNVVYKYRLSGANEEWVYTKTPTIFYPMLPDGKYKFEVYAMNKDGVYSTNPATVEFIIRPPFWKTWWFIGLCVLFIAVVIRMIFYFRVKAIKKTNELKMQLNKYMQQALSQQMNPHFIFNSLNSIQYYILKNDKTTSNRYLAKFSRLMRMILNNSQHQQITIQEELEALSIYIELESLRFKDKFEYTIIVDEKLDTSIYKIPPLLLQPYIENAIWHGLMHKEEGQGVLTIELKMKENIILCTITDNGVGRDKAAEIKSKKTHTYASHGTKITGNRLKLISTLNNIQMQINYIDLKDDKGKVTGTKVEITIPLIK